MKIRSAVDAYDRIQESYVVAYLDILGITARIKGSAETQTDTLNVLHNLYTFIYELADSKTGIKKYADIKFKVFSCKLSLTNVNLMSHPLSFANLIESIKV